MELAYEYIADSTSSNSGGMYEVSDLGENDAAACSLANASPVVGIDGWTFLPTNNYTMVMNALAKVGPLAIAGKEAPLSTLILLLDTQTVHNFTIILLDHALQLKLNCVQ